MKRIAVVTAGFNAAGFIKNCIDSVKSSVTDDLFEIIHVYVDDASEDNSISVLQENSHPNLVHFKLDKNSGPSYARNLAISKVECDYVFHLDADDVLFQNSLKYLFIKAEESNSRWVYGDFLRTNEDLKYKMSFDYYGWPFKSVSETLRSMYTGWHFFQGNCLYERSLFDEVGGFNEDLRLGEDFELFTKFLLKDSFPLHLSCPLYLHREHSKNVTKVFTRDTYKELHRENVKMIFNLYSDEILKRVDDEAKKWILDYLY